MKAKRTLASRSMQNCRCAQSFIQMIQSIAAPGPWGALWSCPPPTQQNLNLPVCCVQIYWFGPLLGGVCGGAFYDMVYSTQSSFSRIRTCMLVFHPTEENAADAKKAPKTTPDVENGGDDKKLEETVGELGLVEVEYSGEPKGEGSSGSDNKPRRDLVWWHSYSGRMHVDNYHNTSTSMYRDP